MSANDFHHAWQAQQIVDELRVAFLVRRRIPRHHPIRLRPPGRKSVMSAGCCLLLLLFNVLAQLLKEFLHFLTGDLRTSNIILVVRKGNFSFRNSFLSVLILVPQQDFRFLAAQQPNMSRWWTEIRWRKSAEWYDSSPSLCVANEDYKNWMMGSKVVLWWPYITVSTSSMINSLTWIEKGNLLYSRACRTAHADKWNARSSSRRGLCTTWPSLSLRAIAKQNIPLK